MAKKLRSRTAMGALWRAFRQSRRPGAPGFAALLAAVPRMVKARMMGQYQGVSFGKLTGILVGMGYIVSPIDLMPEALLLVFGVADDALVLTWVVGALVAEAEQFIEWERAGKPGVPGPGMAAPQAANVHVASEVIDGEVVDKR